MSLNPPPNNKTNSNPTFIEKGIPVVIYLTKQELEAMGTMAKLLHQQFKVQKQKFLQTPDIREFVKFATLTYYNMVVLRLREEEKSKTVKQTMNKAQPQEQPEEDLNQQYM